MRKYVDYKYRLHNFDSVSLKMSAWWQILSRRKHIGRGSNKDEDQSSHDDGSPKLARVLTTIDLTALGVGSTLGVGVYVLAGHVARDTAGPSVVLSFLIAAVASVFAGLCYAEFGARVPRAGSAYIYSYATIGEFVAFIIGWNLILEYVIGSASVAKGLSIYLDSLLNNTMRTTFLEIAPVHSEFLSNYFDFFSFGITLLLGAALAFGLKESSLANNIFTFINILVVGFVIIAGSIIANPMNWHISSSSIPPGMNGGSGGFFPFGIAGTIKGAATCFYGFVGFDCIATTGEEVKNPKRAIPISIISSLFIIFLAYFGTSAVVTMMLPYYLQDPEAPIPYAFEANGWIWAKWIVSIGGIFGLCASLFGAMFPLPRIIYAMANDALVFRFLGSVNSKFRTPVIGTLLAALLTGLMSALFNLKQLVNMMSIGTLLAYTIVAACVIILRYSAEGHIYEDDTENLNLIPPVYDVSFGKLTKQVFNISKSDPTYLSQKLITVLVFIFCILCLILSTILSFLQTNLENGDLEVIIPIGIVTALMLLTLLMICGQPTSNANLSFKVPLVPLIPALSICINIYLMMMLDSNTWVRFGIWMAIGLPIYLISSCILYKKPIKTLPKTVALNGHSNGHQHENGKNKNGKVLTIPEILVDSPKTEINKNIMETQKSETNEKENNIRERTNSIDSFELNNAVLEIDKVNEEFDDVSEKYEAINPENEYKNSMILTRHLEDDGNYLEVNLEMDKISIYSTDSESDHSREHHVEAQVHQEDSDEPNNEELGNQEIEADQSVIEQQPNIEELKEIEEKETDVKEIEEKEIEEVKEIEEKEMEKIKEIEEETEIKENTQIEVSGNIPIPPPISGLLNSSPKTPRNAFTVDFTEVKLKPRPVTFPITSQETTDEAPTDNVRPGSTEYNNIKEKLNGLFKNKKTFLMIPEMKYIQENKTPSPNIESILMIDDVLAQYEEEVPEDFGKTKEFKDNLNKLLLTKHSTNSNKSNYSRKYEKNNENVNQITKKDEINHKNEMAETLRSIKSLNDIKNSEDEEENKDEDDKEKHKKLMLATFRSIKLERIGLPLTDEERRESREEVANMMKTSENETKKENIKPETINDKEDHKKLMLATFRSIKLKRTGLPLTDEERRESREEVENMMKTAENETKKENIKPETINDKEIHKKLMLATLRSIKLRKTGLPLTDEDINSSKLEKEEIDKANSIK